jgi:rare lipoprotein A
MILKIFSLGLHLNLPFDFKVNKMKLTRIKFGLATFAILGIVMLCSFLPEKDCYLESGHASYYANKFHGRQTSSGEIFSQNKYTAAHQTLAFGSIVRVQNLDNDSIVYVKINDRLPRTSKRLIDLSIKAAKDLNFIRKGTAQVLVERVQ